MSACTPELVEDLHARLISSTAGEADTLSILRSIAEIPMEIAVLRSIPIARTVGKLRKSPNRTVAAMAADIVSSWKALEDPPGGPPPQGLLALAPFLLSPYPAATIADQHTDASVRFDETRGRDIRAGSAATAGGSVVYWMSRDQRISDNWALLKAQEIAISHKAGLSIVFCLSSSFLGANKRHFGFMLRGLKELEGRAAALHIPFCVLCGAPADVLPAFVQDNHVSTIVCDFSPLRIAKEWKDAVAAAMDDLGRPVQLLEVDAHNIAPCQVVSNKCEFSARTIRTKIHKAMDAYLTEFPPLVVRPHPFAAATADEEARRSSMWRGVAEAVLPQLDDSVEEIDWLASGEAAAWAHMRAFLPRLRSFADQRNDPCAHAVSDLSPYFHFGHLSVQRVLLEIKRAYKCGTGALFPSGERTTGIHTFCEEAVVRKELSDNFCNFNTKYDSIEGAHSWAQSTLRDHWDDKRDTLLSLEQLEEGSSGDPLWNAAQREMVAKGKMHGFMRMYWAKKILEWSPDPAEALRRAIYLNDKYSLDGRDPNGYVGCMWAIAGVHDRAWGRRPVFGTIRYMNYDGCKRKFDVAKYIHQCGGDAPPPTKQKKARRSATTSDSASARKRSKSEK